MLSLRVAQTDADLELYRGVMAVISPDQRNPSVAEMRARERATRLLLLAEADGVVVGNGFADKSDLVGRAYVTARVVPRHRRRGYGTIILQALIEAAKPLGLPTMGTGVDDTGSKEFAERFGFVEVDREVEQLRTIGDEPAPKVPDGITIVSVAERPELWREAYHSVGLEGFADLALEREVSVTEERWMTSEMNEPKATFLALAGDEIVGVACLMTDEETPDRAEHGLTAVRRAWRGRGIASTLKRQCLAWAAANGIREVYTWTQKNNADMRRLNEHLGYRYGLTSFSLEAPLPLPA